MSKNKKKVNKSKKQLHPFNIHRGRYDFEKLIETSPALKPFVSLNKHDDWSIDFSDPKAVKMLNTALLLHFYDLDYWEMPDKYLCPPVPGRADYIHYAADLIAKKNGGKIVKGDKIRCLDIGTGANCIYPIIGTKAYEWSFVGTDIDPVAIESAQNIINNNTRLKEKVTLRLQENAGLIFKDIIKENEYFDLTICNPPFHASLEELKIAAGRKFYNLNDSDGEVVSNFGGQSHELCCEGGEKGFIRNMIKESREYQTSCFWFTTLVSKRSNLKSIEAYLEEMKVSESKTIAMHQGNKSSRIVAWTFLDEKQQKAWTEQRWKSKE